MRLRVDYKQAQGQGSGCLPCEIIYSLGSKEELDRFWGILCDLIPEDKRSECKRLYEMVVRGEVTPESVVAKAGELGLTSIPGDVVEEALRRVAGEGKA
jgi:hypothetical protein